MGRSTDSTAPESDERLTARARAGDESAVAELFERHHSAVTAYARTLTRTSGAAEDLASEAFTLTLRAVRGGGGPQQSWRRYLLTVARNTAISWSAAQRRTLLTADFGDWADRQDESLSPDEALLAGAEHRLVAAAYAGLPERWRTVLWHAVVERQSPERIAPLLGLTPSGVSSLVSRAREGLREAYLSAHVRQAASPECRAHAERLVALVRRPGRRHPKSVVRHLDDCPRCRAVVEELRDVNRRLRTAGLAAVLPWGGGHAYLAAVSDSTAVSGGPAGAVGVSAGLGAKAATGMAVAGVAVSTAGVVVAAALGASASHPGPSSAAPSSVDRRPSALAFVSPPANPSADPTASPTVRPSASATVTHTGRPGASPTATHTVPSGGSPAAGAPVPPGAGPTAGAPAPSAGAPAAGPTASAVTGPAPSDGRTPTAPGRATTSPHAVTPAPRAPDSGDRALSAHGRPGTALVPGRSGDQAVELRFAVLNSCVSVAGYDGVDGAAPYTVPCESTNDQRWYLRPGTSAERVRVVSAANGGCLRPGEDTGTVAEGSCGIDTKDEWQTLRLGGTDVALRHGDTGQLLGAADTGADGDRLRLQPATCGTAPTCKDKVAFRF
ncbi:sigma-70 family RNA polymerase sigma factor [Kitasatospora sp. NPDC059327]|uniref:sigma-70 family RNA polymerase sigma factor n=1 Tax=Kitasatospora sp. NPDC059327 TaxID=3346803 RepID=UPI00368DB155